jgi:hypothetical protein
MRSLFTPAMPAVLKLWHLKAHQHMYQQSQQLVSSCNTKRVYRGPVADLWREGVSRVCVCIVEEDSVRILEALQVWVVQQLGAEAHVTTVDVAPTIRQLKQHLGSAWAVVGINESDRHTCRTHKI